MPVLSYSHGKKPKQRKIKYRVIIPLGVLLVLILAAVISQAISDYEKNDLADQTDILEIHKNIKTIANTLENEVPWRDDSHCVYIEPQQYGVKDRYYCKLSYVREVAVVNESAMVREINNTLDVINRNNNFIDTVLSKSPDAKDLIDSDYNNKSMGQYGYIDFNLKRHYSKLQNCAFNYRIIAKQVIQESVVCMVDTEASYTQFSN